MDKTEQNSEDESRNRTEIDRYEESEVWVIRDEYSHGTIQIHSEYPPKADSNRFTVLSSPNREDNEVVHKFEVEE